MQLFDRFITYKGKEHYIQGNYYSRVVNDSFSHQFGVERREHEEVCDFDITRIERYDGAGEYTAIEWCNADSDLKSAINDTIMQMEVSA